MDVMATALDAAGVSMPAGYRIDGGSLRRGASCRP
jgi:hypothetical protein